MKCHRCGHEHLPQEACRLNEPDVQRFLPPSLERLSPELPEFELPQFEAPKFDIPETGPLDPDNLDINLPRFKPPLFDLPKSKNHLT